MNATPIHLEKREKIGHKRVSPTANRNKAPILEGLNPFLHHKAKVLEIASGTGEHARYMCENRQDLIWQPTDPDAQSRESQNAWRSGIENRMLKSLSIDVVQPDWAQPFKSFEAIYCANMIHIAPITALEGLILGANTCLSHGQILVLYGPFLEGAQTAPSNLEFHQNLKRRNSEWGVRDLDSVKHMFAGAGFNRKAQVKMPKNNRLLIFEKTS